MKKIILLNFLVLLLFNLYQAASVKPAAYTYPMHLFIIAGQSNAFGKAKVPIHQVSSTHVLKWNNGEWLLGKEPTHFGGGFSFAQSFALHLLSLIRDPNYTIGLVPCAVGGSSIRHWQRGQSPYQNCLDKIALIKSITPNATVDGVVFYQGEIDTLTMPQTRAWPGLFRQFQQSFREDVGNKDVPIIFAQIGPNPHLSTRPGWTLLQTLQSRQAGIDPYTKMVVTKNLTVLRAGDMHLTAKSEVIVGVRAANTYYSNFIFESALP
jgi:hypothetical protein